MLLRDYSQAVDGSASLSALSLPLVHLSQQVEESLLGVGNIAVGRPAQELELTHHQLALLELQRQQKTQKHLSLQYHVGSRCTRSHVSALYSIYRLLQYFCMCRLTPVFECSPGYTLALSAVLTQQTHLEIYGSSGVCGTLAVCERGPCVFITLSC